MFSSKTPLRLSLDMNPPCSPAVSSAPLLALPPTTPPFHCFLFLSLDNWDFSIRVQILAAYFNFITSPPFCITFDLLFSDFYTHYISRKFLPPLRSGMLNFIPNYGIMTPSMLSRTYPYFAASASPTPAQNAS